MKAITKKQSRIEHDNDLIIKTEGLSYVYDDGENSRTDNKTPALRDVNISVARGEYIAVLGHNGSGKSTLAKLLNLILTPTSGKIYINGRDVTSDNFTEDDIYEVRHTVGMVFQNPDNQIVATTVEEDVAFGPENLGLPREEIRRRVDEALAVVDMTEYANHAPHKLSGGQKQRVAIAGIIAMKPEVIVFDESTAMLDPRGRREVVDVMEQLNREDGITVINITHYMEEAARADRIIIINDGKVVLEGTPRKVFSNVSYLQSIGLEVPQSRELITKLSKKGINVQGDVLTEDECVEALAAFFERKKSNKNNQC